MNTLPKLLALSAVCFCSAFADTLEDRFKRAESSKEFSSRPLRLKNSEEEALFCRKLKELKEITRLDLRWLNISKETVNCVARSIEDNKSSLKVLDLCDNNIGDDGMPKIANALKNSSIEVIRLENCNLGDRAIKSIAKMLLHTPYLRKIMLNRNSFITDEGGQVLLGELPNTETLNSIGLSSTGMCDEVKQAILEKLVSRGKAYYARRTLVHIKRKKRRLSLGQPASKKEICPELPGTKPMSRLDILAEVATQILELENIDTTEDGE